MEIIEKKISELVPYARFVVLPEWQGLGIGLRFLNAIAEAQLNGHELSRLPGRKLRSSINMRIPTKPDSVSNREVGHRSDPKSDAIPI